MNLYNKVKMIDYIYEDIGYNVFLYKKYNEDTFTLVDKANGKEKQYTLETLFDYLEDSPFNMVKLNLIIEDILMQQALYYSIMLTSHLDILEITESDIKDMEIELKTTLRDITKTFVKKRLYLVTDEE